MLNNIMGDSVVSEWNLKPITEEELILNELNNENDWKSIVTEYKLSEEILETFYNQLKKYLEDICEYQQLSEHFMKKHFKDLDINCWFNISTFQNLSEDFIQRYNGYVSWNIISSCQILSENFIIKHRKSVNWQCISKSQKLSEKFIKAYIDKIDFILISRYQQLSMDFILKYENKLDMTYIAKYQESYNEYIDYTLSV